jgi:hypothetical protein
MRKRKREHLYFKNPAHLGATQIRFPDFPANKKVGKNRLPPAQNNLYIYIAQAFRLTITLRKSLPISYAKVKCLFVDFMAHGMGVVR